DNDTAGVATAIIGGSSATTESGGTVSFTMALSSQPTADVTIPISSSNTAEGTVSTSSLTFTPANWNVPQTVIVTGVDDQVQDGNQPYTILLGAATSTDPNYNGLNPADVALTNLDNDTAGFSAIIVGSSTTTEAGGTVSFNVTLNSQPTADVTIPVSSSNTAEGTVNTSSLTFTPANWNVPQTVTVTGVDDQVADGSQPYTIVLGAATSADPIYNGLDPADVPLTNLDNDTAGFSTVLVGSSTTSEAGGTASFTMALSSQPTADVTILVSSSNTGEGTADKTFLTFTPANWNVPQTVTVTGIDDQVADGNQAYSIILGAATSTDPNYNGLDPTDVSLTNLDNDTAGFSAVVVGSSTTTEGGGTASFTVTLNSQPTGDVTIPVSSSNTAEGTANTTSLTFTPANWNIPQTVIVTGVDDQVQDGNQPYTIVLGAATSADPNFNGLDPADVPLTNLDNDTAGVSVAVIGSATTTESGGTASFTVVLNSQPTGDVTIPVSSSNTSEGTASVTQLTFTPANWNIPQTVIITGVDDQVADGNQTYSIILGVAVSSDPNFNGLDPT
ncbi:beta strand repeat-containing protein, partial [Zavarzinella formosa]|uniref:beta strand repeat-containing protein n=1 Tax=Zavarzinella formosa TaxID=360055 RepID=UPI00035EA6F3